MNNQMIFHITIHTLSQFVVDAASAVLNYNEHSVIFHVLSLINL